jgi:anti-sigma-K factor RskA
MNASEHNRWSEDLAAYMLGALDSGEVADFERHLEGCKRCQEELHWFEPALQTLPESVERQEAPPSLRANLMAEVRSDVREAESRSVPARSWRNWILKPAAGFAVVALLVAGVVGYEVGNDDSGSGGGASTVVRQVDGLTVKMVQEDSAGTLQIEGLEPLPSDKVLEAWVEREGEVEAVPALFVPDRHGHAEAAIADMTGVEVVMVTEEPPGGSEAPTGEPIMSMKVPS